MEQLGLKIAVITPNVLMNLGLKSILERIVPIAKVYTFATTEELTASGEDFFHYFVASEIFLEGNNLFLEGKRRAIVLTDSDSPIIELANTPHLNINQNESSLIRDILRLHHGAHPNGTHHTHTMPPSTPMRNENVLSAREIEVLTLIAKGLLNKEIADRLNIGLTTVISHRRNIVEKLGMRSVSALTIYAVMRGYVNINEI